MKWFLLATAALLFVAPTVVFGEDSPSVTVYHLPSMDLRGGEDAHIYATVFDDWTTDAAYLAYRPIGAGEFQEVQFKRASAADFVAIVPAHAVQPPGIEYYVGSRNDGAQRLHYASPDAPHTVVVLGETTETREALRLARHNGMRSTFELSGEYANYGRRAVDSFETESNTDWMWASTLQYRYRLLRTLYEIAFGVGVIRGHQDTYLDADGARTTADPVTDLGDGREPGMNYGWGQVTWEAHRNFSTDLRLLLGASATGFAAGLGGTLRIGRIAGTNLELGGEAFQDIGSLAFMRFSWDTLPRLPMALSYELTTRPNPAAPPANRLIYELGFDITPAMRVTGRAGYTLRSAAVQSGALGALQLAYSF